MTTRDIYRIFRRSARLLAWDLNGDRDQLYSWLSRIEAPECVRDALAGEFCNYR